MNSSKLFKLRKLPLRPAVILAFAIVFVGYPVYLTRRENLGQDLIDAINEQNLQHVKSLIARGAEVNARRTRKDKLRGLVKVILDRLDRNNGWTALMDAAGTDSPEIVSELLKHGADVNAKGWLGSTALSRAASKGNPKIVDLLIRNGAQVNELGEFRDPPLLIAAGGANEGPSDPEAAECVSILINAGAIVDARGHRGMTALIGAAWRGNDKTIKVLLDHGADLSVRDERGSTALKYAVESGNPDSIHLLRKAGSLLSFRDAISMGDVALARNLPSDRGDLNAVHASRTMLMKASENGDIESVRLLLDRGADANYVGSAPLTALHAASENGYTKIAQLLLDRGADVNALDSNGDTPLVAPAAHGHAAVVRLLLERGAKIDLSRSPLFLAAFYCGDEPKNDRAEIIKLLLGAGCPADIQIYDGKTALFYAVEGGNIEAVQALIKHGANVNSKADDGSTPLSSAVAAGNDKMATLLRKSGAK